MTCADESIGTVNLLAAEPASMETRPVTAADRNLIEAITETNARTVDHDFFDGAHIVTAGVRMVDGAVYAGSSLPASVGRASVCGEPVAIGSAVADGYRHDEIDTCVAVAYPMPDHDAEEQRVIPPCGTCRELLADYDAEMRVLVPVDGDLQVARAIDLLPTRTW